METRRDFIKKATLLSGGAGIIGSLPPSVKRALAINPDPGTTFEDAEHVVLLMQENRSFDHTFGTLQGVRGFNDPRAMTLPDKNLVWLQSKKNGDTYAPFRLNIKDTKATWMNSLPHSWTNQLDAGNYGRHDRWLEAKRSGDKAFADMPLTLGYYNRKDIPFYYSLADAFTVCDQHFCSSLTGTTPNRLYFWSGTIREEQTGNSPANVNNSYVDYGSPASWVTFPERLEELGISWKIYQNELSVGVGLDDDEDAWLANFTDNPLEWFSQYQVRFLPAHVTYMKKRAAELKEDLTVAALKPEEREKKERLLKRIEAGLKKWNASNFERLTSRQKNLHQKAFTTNENDPAYHELTTLQYDDHGVSREMKIPKGDVLYQFRQDVSSGNLPTVSWLIAPCNFSDHPSAPWYGTWYVSEVLDILTKNPVVWQKTIFILTYDENDGYFDHIPPFTAPEPANSQSGKCSAGISTEVDYLTKELVTELKGKPKDPQWAGPVGLGYRVPFVVASPWSRGGWVNSQVFDHTSVLQFLERFLTKKKGRPVVEENISPWRRAICGDLTSVFRPYNGETITLPAFVDKEPFVESIFNAQFKKPPSDFKVLTREEIDKINNDPSSVRLMPRQEPGIRIACPLPYQLYADGNYHPEKQAFVIELAAGNDIFKERSAGAPFKIYEMNDFSIRDYAVAAGSSLEDQWELARDNYHFRIYGPNGFYRELTGIGSSPIEVDCRYERQASAGKQLSGNIRLEIKNTDGSKLRTIQITDNAYQTAPVTFSLAAGKSVSKVLDLKKSHNWYDFTLTVKGEAGFAKRYAGRVETGEPGYTDPLMGGIIAP